MIAAKSEEHGDVNQTATTSSKGPWCRVALSSRGVRSNAEINDFGESTEKIPHKSWLVEIRVPDLRSLSNG